MPDRAEFGAVLERQFREDDERHIRQPCAQGAQRARVDEALPRADRRAPRHQDAATRIEQPLARDQIVGAIREHLEAVLREPFAGIGKPEPLKYMYPGCWSRRVTQEHRLVYRVSGNYVYFLQAKYHY